MLNSNYYYFWIMQIFQSEITLCYSCGKLDFIFLFNVYNFLFHFFCFANFHNFNCDLCSKNIVIIKCETINKAVRYAMHLCIQVQWLCSLHFIIINFCLFTVNLNFTYIYSAISHIYIFSAITLWQYLTCYFSV